MLRTTQTRDRIQCSSLGGQHACQPLEEFTLLVCYLGRSSHRGQWASALSGRMPPKWNRKGKYGADDSHQHGHVCPSLALYHSLWNLSTILIGWSLVLIWAKFLLPQLRGFKSYFKYKLLIYLILQNIWIFKNLKSFKNLKILSLYLCGMGQGRRQAEKNIQKIQFNDWISYWAKAYDISWNVALKSPSTKNCKKKTARW